MPDDRFDGRAPSHLTPNVCASEAKRRIEEYRRAEIDDGKLVFLFAEMSIAPIIEGDFG
jgi:hypothetical protein